MRGRAIAYNTDEIAWLDAHRMMIISDYHREFVEAFGRPDVSAAHLHALRKRKGWKTGRTGQFRNGNVSHNKGKKMPFNANSARTQFKKGVRLGVAARIYKPIGTERLSKDGYRERKIHDGMPFQSRWRAVHLIEWEAKHGPMPPNHALKCLDGDKANTAPSNWELVPRAMLPRLNGRFGRGYDQAAAEVKPTIMAIAKLEHRARTIKKERTT